MKVSASVLSSHPHTHLHPPGVPQPFLPRSLPLQQHSIMGQPYIELRHRAPEHRVRMAFAPEPQQAAPVGQLVLEQQQQALPTAPLTQAAETVLPGSDGMEEHLEGEDSAVKDLEDVEVKDLVDLNLNLDTEDGRPCPPRSSGARVHEGSSCPSVYLLSISPPSPGKEDLDLGPNDLHLDDFLLSGKFDLIAYADPELDLEDKKDMFNEELDLGEAQTEDREGAAARARRTSDGQVKQEVVDDFCGGNSRPPRGPGGDAVGLLGKVSRSISHMIPADPSINQSPDQAHLPFLSLRWRPLCQALRIRVYLWVWLPGPIANQVEIISWSASLMSSCDRHAGLTCLL